MKILVWVAPILLALIFLAVGGMKVLTPAVELQQAAPGIPVVLLKIAGIAELLGALGLVVPAATRIMPVLTPVAAGGLTATMIGATIADVAVGAYAALPTTIVLALACALIGWARVSRYAIHPRGPAAAAAVS